MITVKKETTQFKQGDILERKKDGAIVIITSEVTEFDKQFMGTLICKNSINNATVPYHYTKWDFEDFSYFRGKITLQQ